ncbi:hypothetical protein BJP36_41550 [Moorena producens JHB]|uniref:Uncharacterized protein n=1 Tax=Moorena producens (strain JHB) TaxID=1454205 RepID=A0A9Q9SSJ2_MOOP1|nr:hypothetical protein [Moorena producens]WAN68850.1 hypothetical protein BJP36_41550 [Moorena producens JHB]
MSFCIGQQNSEYISNRGLGGGFILPIAYCLLPIASYLLPAPCSLLPN